MPDDLSPAPWKLVPNEASLLDVSDLVFIDPVTTGYSRSAEEHDDGDFHGLEADTDVVAEFIRLYLTRHERWLSPKYIAGESYGTTRAAALAQRLQGRHGVFLNGVILVSADPGLPDHRLRTRQRRGQHALPAHAGRHGLVPRAAGGRDHVGASH